MIKSSDFTYADAHKSAKNDGTVEFSACADKKEAIEKFDGYKLYGRRLRVYEDSTNRRSRSGSRRSRLRSRKHTNSNLSRSPGSFRRQKSRSIRRRRDRSESSERQMLTSCSRRDSRKRYREPSGVHAQGVLLLVLSPTTREIGHFHTILTGGQWLHLVLQAAMAAKVARRTDLIGDRALVWPQIRGHVVFRDPLSLAVHSVGVDC
ncbi:uncharacterized protein DEA37_0013162 [Paragonimus westermani]|uniref:RRM domain-containing protein n=1 Tax=Paragonimus westermani TaxID=34504 RepID=A0A5J4NXI6_9TREM|nr:uncharacterized protein DEA37_0013162 [Paragonimus westermani]